MSSVFVLHFLSHEVPYSRCALGRRADSGASPKEDSRYSRSQWPKCQEGYQDTEATSLSTACRSREHRSQTRSRAEPESKQRKSQRNHNHPRTYFRVEEGCLGQGLCRIYWPFVRYWRNWRMAGPP